MGGNRGEPRILKKMHGWSPKEAAAGLFYIAAESFSQKHDWTIFEGQREAAPNHHCLRLTAAVPKERVKL